MNREALRTPDEFVAAEFARVMLLFGKALPTDIDRTSFEQLTREASAKGLNWIEALEYVAVKRAREAAEVAMRRNGHRAARPASAYGAGQSAAR